MRLINKKLFNTKICIFVRKKVLLKDLHYLCTLSPVKTWLPKLTEFQTETRIPKVSRFQAYIILVIEGKNTTNIR